MPVSGKAPSLASDSLRDVLDELDSGLEACREMNLTFADPSRLLA